MSGKTMRRATCASSIISIYGGVRSWPEQKSVWALIFLVLGILCASYGCTSTMLEMPGSDAAPVAATQPERPPLSPAPDGNDAVFTITEAYFKDTFRKADGYLHSAKDLYETGLAREAMPYLDTALLTMLDSQIELSEYPQMKQLYLEAFELNTKILKSNPEVLDVYLDNRWSHFNAKNYTVPIGLNSTVRHFIEEYQTASRGFIERSLSRSGKYMPMIQKALSEANMPEDLAYLVIVESGFSPKAKSYAGARGLWQFMPSTGKRYGLRMNYWVDERCDPEKSTRAAIGYLKDLYAEFKSWKLVLAAYNGGEGRVRRAIKHCGTNDFGEIASSDRLHRQTQEYVPRFEAATIVAKYPEKFGFYINYKDPLLFDKVVINGWMDLKVVAKCTGTTYKTLKRLNPELRRWCTPPIYSKYTLKIPHGTSDAFWANYEKLPRKQKSKFVYHRVKYGETLSSIARRYGTKVQTIRRDNGLRSTRIKARQKLMIRVMPRSSRPRSRSKASSRASSEKWAKTISYRVQRHDTLYDIAKKFGSSVSAIKRANGLRSSRIKVGQKLFIPILSSKKKKK